ncbi:MAG: HNH endonuclease signature motif containing protein [Patescibacteria group bacterium]
MPIGVYKRSEEYKRQRSRAMKGRKIFWKDKISKSLKGHLVSTETRKKLSDKFKIIAKEKGFGKWMKGKKYTKVRNKNVSNGLKQAYKAGKRRRFHFKETKEKISRSRKGKPAWNKGIFGKKSHTWKGGLSFEPYSSDWTRFLKRSIRERDQFTCQICSRKQGEEERAAFHVHHINYNKKDCRPNNLVTLCQYCHIKTNFNRNYWEKYFYEKRDYSYR